MVWDFNGPPRQGDHCFGKMPGKSELFRFPKNAYLIYRLISGLQEIPVIIEAQASVFTASIKEQSWAVAGQAQ